MRLLLVAVLGLACAGCNTMSFERQDQTGAIVRVSATRFMWATESYKVTLQGVGGIEATKSTVDSIALGAVAEGVAKGLATAAKP